MRDRGRPRATNPDRHHPILAPSASRYEDLAGVLEREGEKQAKCFASAHTGGVQGDRGEGGAARGGPAPKL